MVESLTDYLLQSSNAQNVISSPVPMSIKRKIPFSELELFDPKTSSKSLKQELEDLFNYLYLFKPLSISTPFKGTSFQFTKDSSKVFFGSREGKIGIANLDSKQMIAEIELEEGSIWWIALANNDSEIYCGGQSGLIKKFQVNDTKQSSVFVGHSNEVNVIIISNDGRFMYSCGDDGKVIEWDLASGQNNFRCLINNSSHSFLGMHLSEDQRFLAAVGNDTLWIYDLQADRILNEINDLTWRCLWSVNIIPKNLFIATGNDFGVLTVLKFHTWERLYSLNLHHTTIRALKSTKDGRFIATASYDQSIKICEIQGKNLELELNGHTAWIKSIEILDDERTIISMSDDKTIRSWTIPKFDFYEIFKFPASIDFFHDVLQCSSDPNILIIFTNQKILNFHLQTLEFAELNREVNRYIYAYNKLDDVIVIIDEYYSFFHNDIEMADYVIYDYKGSSLEIIRETKASFHGVASMAFSNDFKVLAIGEHHRVTLLNYPDYTVIHSFLSHKGMVTGISITVDRKLMFSFDHEGQFKSYDLEGLSELKALNQKDDPKIASILDCPNNEFFITFDKEFNLHLWSTAKQIKLWSKQVSGLISGDFDSYSGSLFLLFEWKLVSLSIPSMETEFEISSDSPLLGFTFSSDNSKIIVISEREVTVYQNPHACPSISAFGNTRKIFDFYKYIGSLMSSKPPAYDSQFNSWILEPFHINMLHIYTYLNLEDFMQQAINDNIGFVVSRSGYSPLDICLELNYDSGIDIIYRKLKRNSIENPFFLSLIEKSIPRICSDRSERNTKILNLSFPQSIDKSLQKFTHAAVNLPIVAETQTIFTDQTNFTELTPFSVEGQPVDFRQTYFRVCLLPGALKSMQLTEAILETENDRIFSTNFINILLNEKWKQVRAVLWTQAIIYFVYLFSLSFYSVENGFVFLLIAFLINVLLLFYELRQLAAGWSYFKDVWNYLDLITTVLMVIMFVMWYLGGQHDSLTSVVLLFSWARGISYFRIIKQTRYYINLLRNVLADILPFLTIVLYSTLAFAVIFQVLDSQNPGFSDSFSMTWEMNIGGFETGSFNRLTYFYFFLHSVLNPILMLNLLISIMSFTFDQVNSNVEVADAKELASMILEGENIFYWNREKDDLSYLHVCQPIEREKSPDDLNVLMKNMKKKISIMTVNQEKVLSEVSVLKNNIGSIESKQDLISRDIKELLTVLKPNMENE